MASTVLGTGERFFLMIKEVARKEGFSGLTLSEVLLGGLWLFFTYLSTTQLLSTYSTWSAQPEEEAEAGLSCPLERRSRIYAGQFLDFEVNF